MHRLARTTLAATVAALALTLTGSAAVAQNLESQQTTKYLELLRQDLRTQKTAIVTEAMDLTDTQSEAFWPIYEQYSSEMREVWDGRVANMKLYAENYQRMTDDMARQLARRAFQLDEQRSKVVKKYYGRIEKAIGPMLAGRWVQVEAAIYDLISLQLAAELPLMK